MLIHLYKIFNLICIFICDVSLYAHVFIFVFCRSSVLKYEYQSAGLLVTWIPFTLACIYLFIASVWLLIILSTYCCNIWNQLKYVIRAKISWMAKIISPNHVPEMTWKFVFLWITVDRCVWVISDQWWLMNNWFIIINYKHFCSFSFSKHKLCWHMLILFRQQNK